MQGPIGLTRREYALGLARDTYRDGRDLEARDLLGRLLERELGRSYDRLGQRKEAK